MALVASVWSLLLFLVFCFVVLLAVGRPGSGPVFVCPGVICCLSFHEVCSRCLFVLMRGVARLQFEVDAFHGKRRQDGYD